MVTSHAFWLCRTQPAIWAFALIAAHSALAEDPKLDTPPQREAPTAFAADEPAPVLDWGVGEGKSYLVAAYEIPAFVFLLNRYDHHAVDAQVYASPISNFKTNTHRKWVVDNDAFATNQFLHPYQGAFYQGLARSSGLNFWESSVYTFAGSLLWEMAGENTRPSINDQLASGISGSFLGEPLFRMASLLLETDSRGEPRLWRRVAAARAELVVHSATAIGRAIRVVGDAVIDVNHNVSQIADETRDIASRCDSFAESVTELVDSAAASTAAVKSASIRTEKTLGFGESIMVMTTSSGFETIDTKFVNKAIEVAAQVEARFAAAIASGEITAADLFDKNLVPLPGTDPQQYMTRYIPFLDRALAPICDSALQLDERMVFCAFTDHNLLIPSHNPQFRKPHGADPIWNASNGRNRRIYRDKTAVAVSRNTKPYLLQTYRRDMGGGVFALMKDASAPIRVEGRLWGGLRVCYRA